MALLSDKLKCNGVKISTSINGVDKFGSGVVYVTPNYCNYNYVLTAKHTFQEDSTTEFDINDIISIKILYSDNGKFKNLESIKKDEVSKHLIVFEEDLLIITIGKEIYPNFHNFFVSDTIKNEDSSFFLWATFKANPDDLHLFKLDRNDFDRKRYSTTKDLNHSLLKGISGAGVFNSNKSILYGIIYGFPNEEFQNKTIDCVPITFSDINLKLRLNNKVELDTESTKYRKEINQEVVNIHHATINDVSLNLELARKRLQVDIEDDWFYDPLKYIDLLNVDYLFKQFEPYFGNETYKVKAAEKFHVPKKQFTLRQALISPFRDRIIYMATVGVFAEKLDQAMITNVYSARYNYFSNKQLILNGVEQWKKMKYKLHELSNKKDNAGNFQYGCVLEIDLLNFYDNINKDLLCTKITRICETKNEFSAIKLLRNILKGLSKSDLGLPQNSDASSLLASFYLNQVDVFMQHISPAYFRFMDDIRIFCANKYEARKILQKFELELNRCNLSINSQKTKILQFNSNSEQIINNEIQRNHYSSNLFDLELSKISKLRKSNSYLHLNDAFHLSIKLLEENLMNQDINDSEDSSRKLNFALNTITILANKKINLYTENSRFENLIQTALIKLKDNPWITTQICQVLNLLPTETIESKFFDPIKTLLINEDFNIYSFQTYQLWLLLAKHKCNSIELKQFSVKQIEKNDKNNEIVTGAMIIYMCSIDKNYKRVILRKFEEGFSYGYFQKRLTSIALRTFSPDLINDEFMDETLINAHEFTNRHKNKDLVFVQGFNENDEDFEHFINQLYSI